MRIGTVEAAPADAAPQGAAVRLAAAKGRVLRPDAAAIAEAAACLRAGELVAFATETVYGLGADATNARAVARIFAAKRRPHFNPLIVHVASLAAAEALGTLDPMARALAERFWPGPLTLLVPRRPGAPLADIATAGLASVALRVPSSPAAAALLAAANIPVAAPSANRSGHVSATSAAHVLADLAGEVALVLDDGPARHGIESTIVEIGPGGPPRLMRAGAIPAGEIEAAIDMRLVRRAATEAVTAPGQTASHYAPRARLRLDIVRPAPGEALVAFGPPPAGTKPILSLSPGGDLVEAAANLFWVLRRLDELGIAEACVMPVPAEGLGEAINDRLARAAAPRPRPASVGEQ